MPAWRMGRVFSRDMLNQFRRSQCFFGRRGYGDVSSGINGSICSTVVLLDRKIMRKLSYLKPQCISGQSMLTQNLIIEVLSLLKTEQLGGARLSMLATFLEFEMVISVLRYLSQSNEDPRVCFRFFIWTSGKARFQSKGAYNIMVGMLMENNNRDHFDLYWSVLEEFKDKNLPVSTGAFLVLMLGYWRLNKAENVVETFDRMKNYDCKPNLDAYNLLLIVLVKNDLILMALAVYNVILKSDFKMTTQTYNVLLNGLCKGSRTEVAVTLFNEMTARGIPPDVITYTVVISGMCNANKALEAHRIFNMMKPHGCEPDLAAFNALLSGFFKCGQIDKAFKFIESMKKDMHNMGLRGVSCVIHGLIRTKSISKAVKYFKGAIDAGLEPDLILYTIMIRGLCNQGRIRDATKMFRNMIGKGIIPDTQCYNTLIKGFCDKGLLDEAKSLIFEISQHNDFPNTCTHTILICGLCRNGLIGDAHQMFKDMEKVGCLPSAVTFNAMIDGFCKVGELEKAEFTFYKMEIVPSVFLRLSQGSEPVLDSASLQNRVEKMVSSGLIFEAYMLLTKLSSGVVPNIYTYNILINGMCKAGKVSSALGIFKELQLKRCVPDSVTYATLIDGLQWANREGDAYKIFEQMTKAGLKPNSDVYKTFMTWACRRKKISVAFDLWFKYLRTLPCRDDKSLKLIENFLKKGDMEKAFRSLVEIDIKFLDFDSGPCNIVVIGLCQDNRIEEAMKAFYILEEFNVIVSAPGCVKLIYTLCSKGKLEEAVNIFVYSMQEGYRLMPPACNFLLKRVVRSYEAKVAYELVIRMVSAGYDLNSCLAMKTKALMSSLVKIGHL